MPLPTFTYTPKEIEALIREDVRRLGFELKSVAFNVYQGDSDPREPSSPGLTNATVQVTPLPKPSGPPANMLNGNY